MNRPTLLRYTSLALLTLLTPIMGSAQSIDSAAVDRIMQDALEAWQCPGAAIAIVKGDKVVYLKGMGVKKAGGSDPVTPDTLFAIASTSKAFTCTAIAMLVMDGKMKWDDPVRKHVEFFQLADPLVDRMVTLRDIVTHRTGLTRHDMLWLGSPWDREEVIRRIGHVKLTHPFRASYYYQNIMYLTAGVAVGKTSGSSWEEFTQQRIFDPLGMKGANFSATDALKARDRATPHLKNDDGRVEEAPWRNINNIGPAGSINAGVRDLSKWLRFRLGDGTFEGKRLLPARLLQELHAPQTVIPLDGPTGVSSFTRAMNPETTMMSYALGWVVQDYRGVQMISHGGSIGGFRAQVALLPKQKIGMVILSNLGRTSLPEAVRNSVIDHVLGAKGRDWDRFYLARREKSQAAREARQKKFEAGQKKGTKPSRELAAYTGIYTESAYGPATVSLHGGTLTLKWSSFEVRLEHFHYDTFLTKGDQLVDGKQVVFTLGGDGEVKEMSFLEQEFTRAKSNKQ